MQGASTPGSPLSLPAGKGCCFALSKKPHGKVCIRPPRTIFKKQGCENLLRYDNMPLTFARTGLKLNAVN
jgi:hypothetical protein